MSVDFEILFQDESGQTTIPATTTEAITIQGTTGEHNDNGADPGIVLLIGLAAVGAGLAVRKVVVSPRSNQADPSDSVGYAGRKSRSRHR
jgi:hypothetical protein